MRVIRITIAAALFAAFAALTANAQGAGARPAAPAPQRPATPAPQNTGTGAIAEGKFAVIDTDAFLDEKEGIKRLIAAYQTLNREFKPRIDEIQNIQTKYDGIVKQANDTKAIADQKALAALADQADALKLEGEQKQQALKLSYQKRERELTTPISLDIANALRAFARARGISVVFDLSKLVNVVMLTNENDPVDITSAFIADYNQRNPASTASTAAPGNQ
jgi:Skp family chaperone for outer membrane proteins